MGDRVGPVGTGETSSSLGASGGTQRLSPVNWSMVLDRQEALVSTNDSSVVTITAYWQSVFMLTFLIVYLFSDWNDKSIFKYF